MNASPFRRGFSLRPLAFLLGLISALEAPRPLRAQSSPAQPDTDWRALQTLMRSAPALPPAAVKAANPAAERAREADRFAQAAQQAKDFYTRFPSHVNAAAARKLEVTALLESARLGRTALEPAALALADAYRADKSALREDRFEAALAAERLRLRRKLGGKPPHERPADYEQLADRLRDEFGPIHEVFGLYAGIAAEVDFTSANRIATTILEMRPPPFAKASAEAITARFGLLGQPLRLRLKTVEGSAFELPDALTGAEPTVLFVWTAHAGETPPPFTALTLQKAKVGRGVRWIYVGLGATPAQAAAAKAAAPFAGVHCLDPGGAGSALAQRLKVRSSATVFVLDRRGNLTGFGRVDELPALIAAALR